MDASAAAAAVRTAAGGAAAAAPYGVSVKKWPKGYLEAEGLEGTSEEVAKAGVVLVAGLNGMLAAGPAANGHRYVVLRGALAHQGLDKLSVAVAGMLAAIEPQPDPSRFELAVVVADADNGNKAGWRSLSTPSYRIPAAVRGVGPAFAALVDATADVEVSPGAFVAVVAVAPPPRGVAAVAGEEPAAPTAGGGSLKRKLGELDRVHADGDPTGEVRGASALPPRGPDAPPAHRWFALADLVWRWKREGEGGSISARTREQLDAPPPADHESTLADAAARTVDLYFHAKLGKVPPPPTGTLRVKVAAVVHGMNGWMDKLPAAVYLATDENEIVGQCVFAAPTSTMRRFARRWGRRGDVAPWREVAGNHAASGDTVGNAPRPSPAAVAAFRRKLGAAGLREPDEVSLSVLCEADALGSSDTPWVLAVRPGRVGVNESDAVDRQAPQAALYDVQIVDLDPSDVGQAETTGGEDDHRLTEAGEEEGEEKADAAAAPPGPRAVTMAELLEHRRARVAAVVDRAERMGGAHAAPAAEAPAPTTTGSKRGANKSEDSAEEAAQGAFKAAVAEAARECFGSDTARAAALADFSQALCSSATPGLSSMDVAARGSTLPYVWQTQGATSNRCVKLTLAECENVEFKTTYDGARFPGIVRKCVNAFINTGGGRLFIGVSDNGTAQGVELTHKQRTQLMDTVNAVVNATRPLVHPSLVKVTFHAYPTGPAGAPGVGGAGSGAAAAGAGAAPMIASGWWKKSGAAAGAAATPAVAKSSVNRTVVEVAVGRARQWPFYLCGPRSGVARVRWLASSDTLREGLLAERLRVWLGGQTPAGRAEHEQRSKRRKRKK